MSGFVVINYRSKSGDFAQHGDDVKPSIDVAKKLADLLNTTVAYLVGETQDNELLKDTDMLKRLKDINDLPEQDKQAILYNLDALLRDAKTRLAYK